ncbi:hypothetical protein BATDEDRAFT_23830 [Batrachochytrium dendrobatidis JAM81]|uniref:PABS domain-containing protein n=2 Tax=Batrachochytrium dendrobatidis TaxID=109871 RepID=F4P0C0_BATDJ|nr:uncharacterized protein BATDEDRAFT_23830 [Batrachochytrium dendrobatidis JAM81]EGF81420.1 hypothetical protein BATDEDRAFT_23830 [Batrachochytrium dendrobatidis JAM81]OAJ38522.1 hypothetical protein BDEG_22435 [Batrachochytrium dendrobatidis JEL423]|eukprot:XP_006677850.1 hypothetical protein BATDEDRAFT_23830 [Batrachochytrium dendrobatidis JAM81]
MSRILSGIIVVACALSISIVNSSTLKILAPYYGYYLTTQSVPLAITTLGLACILLHILIPLRRLSTTDCTINLIAFVPAIILFIPFFARVTAIQTSDLGPHWSSLISAIPCILSNILVILWILSRFGILMYTVFMVISIGFKSLIADWILRIFHLNTCHSLSIAAMSVFVISTAALTGSTQSVSVTHIWKKGKVAWILMLSSLVMGLYVNHYSNTIQQCADSRLPITSSFLPDYRVLAHQESNTGYIAVVEAPTEYGPIRLLRCDHSILGGIFLEHNSDSIFGSFYMLDFVRFIKRSNVDNNSATTALQLGLGIGVTVSTLLRAGIAVDIVELDPVVYDYAKSYFNLSTSCLAHIGDGRHFIDHVATPASYDYVLHDVFTGGVVPGNLFTIEAVTAIKRILKPNGIMALNYVGSIQGNATQAVLATLLAVFPHIQGYVESREAMEVSDAMYNMVLFASQTPIEFSEATAQDMQVGGIYAQMLARFKQLRLPDTMVNKKDDLKAITDRYNPLATLQADSALQHWKVMRQLFSVKFWATMF